PLVTINEEFTLSGHHVRRTLLVSLYGTVLAFASVVRAEDAVVYAPLSAAEAKAKAVAWLGERYETDEDLRLAVEELWQFEDAAATTVDERFNAVVQTFYLADESVRELVDTCLAR